jgi:hypothetical protein
MKWNADMGFICVPLIFFRFAHNDIKMELALH